MKIIIGLLLIGVGGYIGWESHSILNWDLFRAAVFIGGDHVMTTTDLQAMNSFLTDILFNIGVDTLGDMQRYLTISRIGGIVIAILGLAITFNSLKK